MDKFIKHISGYDYFGHCVVFTFNQQSSNIHKTFLGGLISLILRFGMITYIGLLIQRMVTRSYDFDY